MTRQDGFCKMQLAKRLEELLPFTTKNIKTKEPNTPWAVLDFLIVSMSKGLRIYFLTPLNYGCNKMGWKPWMALSILEIETNGGG